MMNANYNDQFKIAWMIITYIETVIRVILQLREWLIATGPCVLNKQHEALCCIKWYWLQI